jgi:transcriptional regulator with XRE-family HTH domain
MKQNNDSNNEDFTPDLVVDGVEYELKARRGRPPAVGPNATKVVRRVSASKAQWFCAANPDSPRMDAFARAVRRARIERGWSQAEASEHCLMLQSHWSNLETAQIEPLPEKVFELEKNLKVEPGHLSRHLGYSPGIANDRELFTQVLEKLDALYMAGMSSVGAVMEEWVSVDLNVGLLNDFIRDTEEVGLDVLNTLERMSGLVMRELEQATRVAMPKAYALKANETKKLAERISLLKYEQERERARLAQELADDGENNGYKVNKDDVPF